MAQRKTHHRLPGAVIVRGHEMRVDRQDDFLRVAEVRRDPSKGNAVREPDRRRCVTKHMAAVARLSRNVCRLPGNPPMISLNRPRAPPIRLILPIMVIEELDKLMHHRDGDRRKRTRARSKPCGRCTGKKPTEPTALPGQPDVTVEVMLEGDWHLRRPNNDAEIIDQAVIVRELTGRERVARDGRRAGAAPGSCRRAGPVRMPKRDSLTPGGRRDHPSARGLPRPGSSASRSMTRSPLPRCWVSRWKAFRHRTRTAPLVRIAQVDVDTEVLIDSQL